MIRLFAAIKVSVEAAAAIAPLQRGLAGARWSSAESLHITLRFVGPVSEARADDLDASLGAVTSLPFEARLSGLGAFEEAGVPRALWAGIEQSQALTRLRGRCEAATRRAGLPPDTRRWRPHVTLAYLRDADPARVADWIQAHNLVRPPPFTVGGFGLYSSWRTDAGPLYRLERSYRLG